MIPQSIVDVMDIHHDPKDSQLFLLATGSPEFIKGRLQRMIDDIDDKARYGKPIQGSTLSSDGNCSIITPIWNGRKY